MTEISWEETWEEQTLVARARAFAIAAHSACGQTRKYTGEPYWTHPMQVAYTLARAWLPRAVIAAGWLHDVVEDTAVTIDDIRREFGHEVATLVEEVTDVARPEDGNRATRVALNRAHVAKASYFGKTIKLADLIDNTRTITAADPKFAGVYMREKRELLDVLTHSLPSLYEHAKATVEAYFRDHSVAT